MVDENNETVDNAEHEATTDLADGEVAAPRNMKPFLIAGIVVAALFLAGLYIYLRRAMPETETESKEEAVVSVKVATAERDSISQEISAPGTVAPAEQATVAASISAQIIQMRLLKNAFVQKGDVVAVLASKDLRAQAAEAQSALDEAKLNLETLQKVTIPQTSAQTEKELSDTKANLDNTKATYERRLELYRKGGISLKELEASKLALTNAENAHRLAQQNASLNRSAVNPNSRAIAETKIKQAQDHLRAIRVQANMAEVRAPISGIVTDQFQYEGEFAAAGGRLLTIGDIGQVIVKAQFADTVVASLKTGDMVTIYPTNAPDERMTGKVTLISRASDPQSRAVEVWATFGNPRGLLLSGGAVQFVVSSNATDEAIVVPTSAVTLDSSNADEGTVMVVGKDSLAHETKVKIGIRQGDKVQIVEGLNGGETVVTEGNYALPDGTKVEIAKDEENKDEEK